MDRRWSFATAPHWRPWQFDLPPPTGGRFPPPSSGAVFLEHCSAIFEAETIKMYSGTLINDLFAVVERAETFAKERQAESADSHIPCAEPAAKVSHGSREISKSEKFPQPLRLGPADRNLGLLLVVHAQLVGALEPGDDFADAVDVHQVGAVRPPKKIRV